MIHRTLATLAIASVGLGTHGQALAICMESSFETQIVRADAIFIGTVLAVEPVCEPGVIATRYRFGHVQYLKGKAATDSLALVEPGGVCGTMHLLSEHSLEFRKGARYVVFTIGGRAMACGTGHPFGIWPDSGSTVPVVHVGNSSVVALDGYHLVVVSSHTWTPEMGIWTATLDGRRLPPPRPPKLPLPDLIREADMKYEERKRYLSIPPWHTDEDELMREVWLFPHQDPGTRVGESEFVSALTQMIAKETALVEADQGH